jgi:hypothetical protein
MHLSQRTWAHVQGIVVAREIEVEVDENHAFAKPRISKGEKICMLAPNYATQEARQTE